MGRCRTKRGARAFAIESARATAKGVVARLEGVADRNAAEALKGVDLYVERDRLPRGGRGRVLPRRPDRPRGGRSRRQAHRRDRRRAELRCRRSAGDPPRRRAPDGAIPFTEAFVPEVDIAARASGRVSHSRTDAGRSRSQRVTRSQANVRCRSVGRGAAGCGRQPREVTPAKVRCRVRGGLERTSPNRGARPPGRFDHACNCRVQERGDLADAAV